MGVKQPTINPTNKLTAAMVGSAAISIIGLILKNLFPEWYDPQVLLNATPLVVFACGWFIKDNPNVVIDVSSTDDSKES